MASSADAVVVATSVVVEVGLKRRAGVETVGGCGVAAAACGTCWRARRLNSRPAGLKPDGG